LRKRLFWVLGPLALGLMLASCAPNASQDSLKPEGPYAQTIHDLFVPVFWVAVAVFVIVEGGIVLIMIKYRHRKNRDEMPAQTHGNTRLEIGWTILPAVVLAFVTVPTVAVIWDLAQDPPADALHITVEGHQWWWGFVYTDADLVTGYDDQAPIVTADVMVIPTGRTVYLDLSAVGGLIGGDPEQADYAVIHSFWVPQLAGKQDVVPNRTNHILLQADQPGTYYGQCAEFCGLQHARMKFRVLALSPSDFEAWVANEKQPAVTPQDELARQGAELFANGVGSGGQCISCHAIGGVNEGVTAGPDLTHWAAESHSCFSGCIWDTTDIEALKAWLRDPGGVKLGAKMPDYDLTEPEIDALTAYLMSLT
jgi:cytochrome c oxidase subunit 2